MECRLLEGIVKEAIAAWTQKLMSMTPRARMNTLRNWDQLQRTGRLTNLLGAGSAGVTGQKAAYKVLGNKARMMAMKAAPAAEAHWAGHGMKHVGDVTRNMQAITGSRVINPNLTMAHNAVTSNPLQRQGVLAGLLHDTAKAQEKALSGSVVKENLRKYHHQFQGARNARGFFDNNKELSNLAGINPQGKQGVGATNVVRAIRGHNPAGWRFPSVKRDAYSGLGSRLRTADDTAGNLGYVGAHRTIFNKFTAGDTLRDKGQNAWNFAMNKQKGNIQPYRRLVAESPGSFRAFAENQRRVYWDTLNKARNMPMEAQLNPGQVSTMGRGQFHSVFNPAQGPAVM